MAERHPCQGMTPGQITVFEAIATGDALPRAKPAALKALLAKGLIERLPDKVLGTDAFGEIKIPQYQVPTAVHAQWCQWCAENVPGEL